MADHITLQMIGLREMGLAIDKWGADLEAESRRELEREVEGTVNYLKATAPFKTGNLRKSIGSKVEPVGVNAQIRARAPHAHLVEWGTKRGTKPTHFFVPQVIKARKRFYERIERLLAKVRQL